MAWVIVVSVLSQSLLCAVLGLRVTAACDVVALAIVAVWFVLTGSLAGSDTLTDAEMRLLFRSRD